MYLINKTAILFKFFKEDVEYTLYRFGKVKEKTKRIVVVVVEATGELPKEFSDLISKRYYIDKKLFYLGDKLTVSRCMVSALGKMLKKQK